MCIYISHNVLCNMISPLQIITRRDQSRRGIRGSVQGKCPCFCARFHRQELFVFVIFIFIFTFTFHFYFHSDAELARRHKCEYWQLRFVRPEDDSAGVVVCGRLHQIWSVLIGIASFHLRCSLFVFLYIFSFQSSFFWKV